VNAKLRIYFRETGVLRKNKFSHRISKEEGKERKKKAN